MKAGEKVVLSKLLEEITDLKLHTPTGNLVRYPIKDFYHNKKNIDKTNYLYQLEEWGAWVIDEKLEEEGQVVFVLKILEPKFLDICNTYGQKSPHKEVENRFHRDERGDYSFEGKKINFPESKDTIYFHIFEYLYNKIDGYGAYSDIDKYLVKCGEKEKETEEKEIQRINNGVNSLFDRTNLPKKRRDDILPRIRGKGFRLNK